MVARPPTLTTSLLCWWIDCRKSRRGYGQAIPMTGVNIGTNRSGQPSTEPKLRGPLPDALLSDFAEMHLSSGVMTLNLRGSTPTTLERTYVYACRRFSTCLIEIKKSNHPKRVERNQDTVDRAIHARPGRPAAMASTSYSGSDGRGASRGRMVVRRVRLNLSKRLRKTVSRKRARSRFV